MDRPKVDFTSMLVSGMSREEVTQELGEEVDITFELDPEVIYKELTEKGYKEPYEKFVPRHEQAKEYYNSMKQFETERKQAMGWAADLFMADNVATFSKPANPTQFQGSGGQNIKMNTGEQVMESLGVYKNKAGEYKDLSLYRGLNKEGVPYRVDKNGKELMLVQKMDFDTKQKMWHEVPTHEAIKSSLIRSMGGPKSMRQSGVNAFLNETRNTYVDMFETTIGSLEELTGHAANWMDEDWGHHLIDAGRRNQNLAAIRKSKKSEALENAQLFGGKNKGLAWGGALGSLTAQISSVVLLGGIGGGVAKGLQGAGIVGAKAAGRAAMVPSLGTMSAYAAAMTDQEAKEMGLDTASRLKLYPLIFAASLATETLVGKFLGGQNLLENGLGYLNFESNRAVNQGVKKWLANEKILGAVKNGSLTNEQAASLSTNIFQKLGMVRGKVAGGLNKFKLGKAINSGSEEGAEEFVQGILDGSAKTLVDYLNYGTLDEEGNAKKTGKGLMGMYGKDGANLSALLDGWKENIVLGFIGGAIPGYFSASPLVTGDIAQNYSVAEHVVQMMNEGKNYKDAEKYIEGFMEQHAGQFALQDADGNFVGQGQDGASKAEVFASNWKQKYQLAFKSFNDNIKSAADLQKKLGGDKKLLSEGISMLLNAQKAEGDIAQLQEAGKEEHDPAMVDATDRLAKAKDHAAKIMNGDVYGHYMAVNLLNTLAGGEKIRLDKSNEEWDKYVKASGKVEVDNTFLGKVRLFNQEAVNARNHEQTYKEELEAATQQKLGVQKEYNKFEDTDEAVRNLDVNAHFDDFAKSLKNILGSGQPINQKTLAALTSRTEKVRAKVLKTLIHKLDPTINTDNLDDGQMVDLVEKAEDISASEASLLKYSDNFNFPTEGEEVDAKFGPEYLALRNAIWKGNTGKIKNRETDKAYSDDEYRGIIKRGVKDFKHVPDDIEQAVQDKMTLYPINMSPVLMEKSGSNKPEHASTPAYMEELLDELEKESPTPPNDAFPTLMAIRNELLEKGDMLNLIQAAEATKNEELLTNLGSKLEYNDADRKKMFQLINNQIADIDKVKHLVAAFTDIRGIELGYLEKGLVEVKAHVLPLLGQDFGLSLNPKTPEEITSAENQLTKAIITNPEKLWRFGSQFRELLAPQEDFKGKSSAIPEPVTTSSQSLFNLSLASFNLDNFLHPKPNPNNKNEYGSPYFRKHFVLNYLQSIVGINSAQFLGLAQEHFTDGIEGGVSIEQLMVLKHIVNWTISASNDTLKETQTRISNYLRSEGKNRGHEKWTKGKLHEDKPLFYFHLLVDELPAAVQEEIRSEGLLEKKIEKFKKAIKTLPEDKRKEARRQLDEMEVIGLRNYISDDALQTEKEEFFIPNAINVQGNQGSGKTRTSTILLEMLAKMEASQLSVEGERINFFNPTEPVIVVHSTELAKTFEKQIAESNDRNQGGIQLKATIILKKDFFEDLNSYKNRTVIIDEATLLNIDQRTAIARQSRENGKEYQNLYYFLGDRFQTIEDTVTKENPSKPHWQINQYAVSTHNITQVYRSGQDQVLKQMKDNVLGLAYESRASKTMPFGETKFWHSQDGVKRKGMWVTESYEDLKAHIKERIAQGKIENMAIVVASQSEGKLLLTELQNKPADEIDFHVGLGARVFFFDEAPLDNGDIRHIQGLGAEQIYFASDPSRINRVGYANGKGSFNRMLNTSLGRMRDDGTPEILDSQFGYWAGIVQHRKGTNSKVGNAQDIPAAVLTTEKLAKNNEELLAYIENQIGQNQTGLGNVATAAPASSAKPAPAAVNESPAANVPKKTVEVPKVVATNTPPKPPPPSKPPVVASSKLKPIGMFMESYNFEHEGERWSLKKGDPAKKKGTSGRNKKIAWFEQTNELVYVVLEDRYGNKERMKASEAEFDFQKSSFLQLNKEHSNSLRLIRFGEITLRSHTFLSTGALEPEEYYHLAQARAKLYAWLEQNMEGTIPIKGTVRNNAVIGGRNTTSRKAVDTFLWELDLDKADENTLNNFKLFADELAEKLRPYLHQIGIMPIEHSPKTKLSGKNKQGKKIINEFHAANIIKNGIINRAKAEKLTLEGELELGTGQWVLGIDRAKESGKKKMIGDFIANLAPSQYRILQVPVPSENRVGTFLYYTTIGELDNDPKTWVNNKRIGRVEVLSVPLQATEEMYEDGTAQDTKSRNEEMKAEVKSSALQYINTLIADIDSKKNADWKKSLGDFFRYNRKEISKTLLKKGRMSAQFYGKMGLVTKPDNAKEGIPVGDDFETILITGMKVNEQAANKPDRYVWQSGQRASPKRFLQFVKQLIEEDQLIETLGQVRFPTIIKDAKVGTLLPHPKANQQLHEFFLVPTELAITPPMPIVNMKSALELLDDTDVQKARQAEREKEQLQNTQRQAEEAVQKTAAKMESEVQKAKLEPETEPIPEADKPEAPTTIDSDRIQDLLAHFNNKNRANEDEDLEEDEEEIIGNVIEGDPLYENYTLTQTETKKIITKLLGEAFAKSKLSFEAKPTFNGKRVYGALTRAGIVFDTISENGIGMVEKNTPAEEAFHKIVEEVISMDFYTQLNKDYAISKDIYYGGGIASEQLREAMAKDFNQYFIETSLKGEQPKSKWPAFVQFIFDAIIDLINRLRGRRNYKKFFEQVYAGKFAEAVSRQLVQEAETGMPAFNKTLDLMGKVAIANEDMANRNIVADVFDNNMNLVHAISNYVRGQIYNRPFFSSVPTRTDSIKTKENTFAKVVYNTKRRLVPHAINMINKLNPKTIEVIRGGKGKKFNYLLKNGKMSGPQNLGAMRNRKNHLVDMLAAIPVDGKHKTGEGYEQKTLGELTLANVEALKKGQEAYRDAYFLLKLLESDRLYDSIVQRLFNRVPVKAIMTNNFKGDAMNYGVYLTDSVDNAGSASVNISTRMSDVLRGMIEHTTLLSGTKVGSKVVWSKEGEKFDFGIAKSLLLRIARASSLPGKVGELTKETSAAHKGRPLTRIERIVRNTEKEINAYVQRKSKTRGKQKLESKELNHIRSLYQKFLDPKGLSYYAWATKIKTYKDYKNAVLYEVEQGTLNAYYPSTGDAMLMTEEDFIITQRNKDGETVMVQNFEIYRKDKAARSAKYVHSLEVMFAGMKQASFMGSSIKRFRAQIYDSASKAFNPSPYPVNVFRHYISSKRLGGSSKDMAKQLLSFAFEDLGSMTLSEKFMDAWKDGKSAIPWRKGHPFKLVVMGDQPGIYYVPDGMSPNQAIDRSNQIVAFSIDELGRPTFEQDNTIDRRVIPSQSFSNVDYDPKEVVKEFFHSIGMTRIGGAAQLFANSKGDISWNDFVDILTKFTLVAKSMVAEASGEAITSAKFPKGYNSWYDYALRTLLDSETYGKATKQELTDEYTPADEDLADAGEGEVIADKTQYHFAALHDEMEMITWAMTAGNGLVGDDFIHDVKGNKHYQHVRENSVTSKIDGSGSENYAIYIQQLINRATTDGVYDEDKLDEKVRHLVDKEGHILHPFLKLNEQNAVDRKIHNWFWDDGTRKGLDGKRIQDMTNLDMIDYRFAAFYNHITGRGLRGEHRGKITNTIFPDADRNLQVGVEVDMRRNEDSFGVNFGTIMVNQVKDKDGNLLNEFALPYYDILAHLVEETKLRRNYQRQATNRLADGLILAIARGEITDKEQVEIITAMEGKSDFVQRSEFKKLKATMKNTRIPASVLRFSEAWQHRDYLAKDGYLSDLGYEVRLVDPGRQERILTPRNLSKIQNIAHQLEQGEIGDKALSAFIDDLFFPAYHDTVRRFKDVGFTFEESMNIGKQYFNVEDMPAVMKGFIINHFLVTNYMHSYVNGTPFVNDSMEDANKRSRTATTDKSKMGTADRRVFEGMAAARSILVADQKVVSFVNNFMAGDNELAHIKVVEAQDGLSEENPIYRYMLYKAYGEEMGPAAKYGSIKSGTHTSVANIKHASAVITEDSFRAMEAHRLLLKNMLDPRGASLLGQPNLYNYFTDQLEKNTWDEAVANTAEHYMDNLDTYTIIGIKHHLSTHKQKAKRKVIKHEESLSLVGGVFPTNIGEARRLEEFGIGHFTEPIDPMAAGISNTIAADVDESKVTLSAQSIPVFMANDANAQAVKQLKELLAAMSENGFSELLNELSSKQFKFDLPSFVENIINRTTDEVSRRTYADNLMMQIAKRGLENTGDRGHLQRLLNITSIGMDIAAKALKADQGYSSTVREKSVKIKIAAQRSLDNVTYGSDIVDYQNQIWIRADLLDHLARTNPSAIESVQQLAARELNPMHFDLDDAAFAAWLNENERKLTNVDKAILETTIAKLAQSENPSVPYRIDKKPVIVVDGEKRGVAIADSQGKVQVLMEGERLPFSMDASYFEMEQEQLDALRYALKAKNKFVLDNKIGVIHPAEIIAPSSYADMLDATGIPIHTLFGVYSLSGDNKRQQHLEALEAYRKGYRQTEIDANLAAEANDLEGVTKAVAESKKIEEDIKTMLEVQAEQADDGGYGYESLMGLELAEMQERIEAIIVEQFPLDETGNIHIDPNNPNIYLLRLIGAEEKNFRTDLKEAFYIESKRYKNDFKSAQVRRQTDIENQFYQFRVVKGLAEEMAHNLKKLAGELDGYMMRTPSTGAHSGALTRIISFSSKEQNTVRQSPLNMHISGKDLDGDAVSIYHKEYFHPNRDKGKEDGIKMNALLVQYVMDFYANTSNAPTIFDPISTEFVNEIADGRRTKTGHLSQDKDGNVKKPTNPNNFVKGSVGSDLHLTSQSFTGKHTISNSAHQLKIMSYLISALKQDPNGIYRYMGFQENDKRAAASFSKIGMEDLEMIHQLSNAISTITNLGTDNSKDQTLGVWGLSQQNIGVVLELINNPPELISTVNDLLKWQGEKKINTKLPIQQQTWVALNALLKNEVVQKWIKNQNFISSLRYSTTKHTGAYATLGQTLVELQEDNQDKSKSRKRIHWLKLRLPELRNERSKHLTEEGKAPPKKAEVWEAYSRLDWLIGIHEEELKSLEKMVDPKSQDLIFWLTKKALQSEQTHGFLAIADLNQKMPATEWDLYDWKNKVERLFGLPIDTLFNLLKNPKGKIGLTENLQLSKNGHLFDSLAAMKARANYAFTVKRNFAMTAAKDEGESIHDYLIKTFYNSDKTESINYQEDFLKMDLLPALLASPELIAYVKQIEQKYRLMQADRVVELPQVQAWKEKLIQRVGKDRLGEVTHRWLQNKTREFFIADYISHLARTNEEVRDFVLDRQIELASKDNKKRYYYDVNVNLADTYGTELFMQYFPEWFDKEANKLLTDPNSKVQYEDNAILNLFQQVGGSTVNFLTLIRDQNIEETKKMADFAQLPKRLQTLLSVYAVIKDGFNYRAGSLIESMSSWIYEDFGNHIKNKYLLNEYNKPLLDSHLAQYEAFLLGQTNKYFVGNYKSYGASKIETIGLEYKPKTDGELYVPRNQRIRVHAHNGQYTYASHRDLFNIFRVGADNVVRIQARGELQQIKDKEGDAYNGPDPHNELVVIAMPLKSRELHMRQVIAAKTENPAVANNIHELEMTLVDKGQLNKWKKKDVLFFPDGIVAEITAVDHNGQKPKISYTIDMAKTKKRLKGENIQGAWNFDLSPIARKALITADAHIERASAVYQSIALVKGLKAAFPNVQIQTVHQHEARRLGGGKALSFIKDGIVYINLSKVTPHTVIHEMVGHFGSAALYMENPNLWRSVVNELENGTVGEQVRRAYPELKGNDLYDEYFATWIGLEADKQGDLVKLGQQEGEDTSLWQQVKDFFKDMWRRFITQVLRRPYGLDNKAFNDMSLDDLAATLIRYTLKGDIIIPYTSGEYANMWGGIRMNKSGTRRKNAGKINARNLLQTLEESEFKADPKKRTIERKLPGMMARVQGSRAKDFKKTFTSLILNETFEIEETTYNSPSALKAYLRNIAKDEYEANLKMHENLLSFFKMIESGEGYEPQEAAKQTIRQTYFGELEDNNFLDAEVNMLVNVFGFNLELDKAYAADDPVLKSYGLDLNPALVKDNPIVIVHGAVPFDKGATVEPSFSMFNVVTHHLEQRSNANSQYKNLGELFIYEGDLDYSGVNLYNTVSDINKVFQGLAFMDTYNKAPVKIRNMGTLSLDSKGVESMNKHGFKFNLTDMGSLLPQLEALFTHENMRNNLEGRLKELVEHPDSFEKGRYNQSIMEQLLLIAKTESEYGIDSDRASWDEVYEITKEHLDPTVGSRSMQLKSALARRISYISKQYGKDDYAKAGDKTLQFLNLAMVNADAANPINEITFKTRNLFTKYFETPNNWADPILQHWRDMMVKANHQSGIALQEVVNQTNHLVQAQITRKGITKTTIVKRDISEDLFGHLFKKQTVKRKDGAELEMNLMELHHSVADEATAKLVQEGVITKEELKMANDFLDIIEKQLVEALRNEDERKHKPRRSYREAKNDLEETWGYRRGMLPALGQSFAEAARAAMLSGSVEKMTLGLLADFGKDSLSEFGLYDSIDVMDEVIENEVGHIMLMQFKHPKTRLSRLGIYDEELENGEFERRVHPDGGFEKNQGLTSNLQSIANYNAALTLRAKAFHTHFKPVHDATMQLVTNWGLLNRQAKNSEEIREMLQTIYERVVLGKTKTLGGSKGMDKVTITLPGGKKKIVHTEAILNGIGRIFANAVLGLRPSQLLKEAGILTAESYAFGYNNKAFDNSLFTHKELNKALDFIGDNETFVDKLNELYLVANKSEKDQINGRWAVKTQQSVWESDTLHIGTAYTNYRARKIIMIAQMIKDGSLDAHSMDKKGNIHYDPLKDDRYAENGKFTEDGRKVMAVVRQNLVDTGYELNGQKQLESDMLLKGYDHRNARRMKGIADMFITGGQSSDILSAGMSHSLFRSMMTFRSFSVPKLMRFLVGSGKTAELGEYRVINGEVTYWAPEFKSVIQSYANAVTKFKALKGMPIATWQNLEEADRHNLRQNMLDITMYFAAFAAAKAGAYLLYAFLTGVEITEPDKEPDKAMEIKESDSPYQAFIKGFVLFFLKTANRTVREMTSDAFHINTVYDFLEDPFPSAGYIENMVDLVEAIFKIREMEDLENVLNKGSYQIPGTGLARDFSFTYDTFKKVIVSPKEN